MINDIVNVAINALQLVGIEPTVVTGICMPLILSDVSELLIDLED